MYKNCVLFLFLPFGPNGFFYFANSSFFTHFILFGFFSPLSFFFFFGQNGPQHPFVYFDVKYFLKNILHVLPCWSRCKI